MQVILSEIVTPYGVMILAKCGELFAIGKNQADAEKQLETLSGRRVEKKLWY